MNKLPIVVMILAKAFHTDPRPKQEAKTLVGASYRVFAIAWDRAYEHKSSECVEGVLVRSFRLMNLRRPSSFGLIVGGVLFQVLAFVAMLRIVMETRERVVVHAHDLNTLGAAYLAKHARLSQRLVYDCHELSYGAYSELLGSFIGCVVRGVEILLARCADLVITVSEPIARELGRGISDVQIIYNCPPLSAIPSISKDEARAKLGLPARDFIVSYIGSIRFDSRLDIMLRVADLAQKIAANIRFLIVGAPSPFLFRTWVRAHPDSKITVVGPVSHNYALMYRAASDLTWAVYDDPRRGINTRIGLPWQVFESMACGVPVIVWRETYRAALVNRIGCGIIVDGNNAESILECIEEFSQNWEMQARLSTNAKSASVSEYNWENMSSRLVQVYGSLLVRSHG